MLASSGAVHLEWGTTAFVYAYKTTQM